MHSRVLNHGAGFGGLQPATILTAERGGGAGVTGTFRTPSVQLVAERELIGASRRARWL